MSQKDLIPLNRRTEDEQKEITKKGGIKSGEARRRKRAFRQLAKQYLDTDTSREHIRAALQENGFGDDLTNAAALVLIVGDEAYTGNLRAIELLLKMAGEDPEEKRKDADLKLKRDLIRQQTVKLRNFNYGDDEDNSWILYYRPDEGAQTVWRQVALMEVEDALEAGKDLDALERKWGSKLEDYISRRIAEYLIQEKKKKLKKDGYEAAKDSEAL